MMPIKKGDYVSWNEWRMGYVLEIFPRGLLFIRGVNGNYREHSDFYIQTPLNLKVITLESGYRPLGLEEDTVLGDYAWSGKAWVLISAHYADEKAGFLIRRSL